MQSTSEYVDLKYIMFESSTMYANTMYGITELMSLMSV